MKKFRFLAVALVALAFASCSKEEGVDHDPNAPLPGKLAILNLSFADDAGTKATGEAIDAGDQTITDLSIYVYDKNGTLLKGYPQDKTTPATSAITFEATTAAHSVYVVANGGGINGTLLAPAKSANVSVLKALKIDRLTHAALLAKADMLMTGKNSDDIVFSDDPKPKETVAVLLAFPVSKVLVTIKDTRKGNTGTTVGTAGLAGETNAKTKITDNHVAVLYSGKSIPIFAKAISGLDQNVHASFYSGLIDYVGYTGSTLTTIEAVSHKDVATPANWTGEGTTAVDHHFYIAANNAATKHTIITIVSTKVVSEATNTGLNGTTQVYYPVKFVTPLADDPFTANGIGVLEVANSYDLVINLSGIVNNGAGVGVDSPETNEPVADMAVTITAAKWTTVEKSITFN